MPGIDPSFIIAAMLQRRNGIDMISKAYEQTTVYAKPDRLTRKQPSFSNDNAGQNLLSGEPDIDWDSAYPETGAAARKIALRNKPGTKPVEHRKSIVTNRVQAIDPNTNTRLRLESSLEHDAMIMFMADPKVVAIQAQFGPVWFKREDVWHKHYFDLCVDYASGCRGLFAVRHQKKAAEVEHDLELIRSHDLRNHAHFARVLTEKIITRPAVYSASQILRARRLNNEENNRLVMNALKEAGGVARVADVLSGIPDLTVSCAWDALWALIGRGQVAHHHIRAHQVNLEFHSLIRLTEGVDHEHC